MRVSGENRRCYIFFGWKCGGNAAVAFGLWPLASLDIALESNPGVLL